MRRLRAGDAHLESVRFDAPGFEEVVVGVEVFQFGREHRKFGQFVLSQRQLLQQGEIREGPVFDL